MNKKHILPLCISIILTGCASYGNNPGLAQLEGKHISVVQERIDNFVHTDIGLFSNDYYLYRDCVYSGYDNVTTNYWGVVIDRQPIYNCGSMFFTTDKDGIITNYTEKGYVPQRDYQPLFKDIIVIER
ncbi:hypothetical protein [Glaesserella sp.]|uniref:hypothetical protein n=1 Tax=Glaesserella sp. TaxID=2094731 RepID=UPI0035A11073